MDHSLKVNRYSTFIGVYGYTRLFTSILLPLTAVHFRWLTLFGLMNSHSQTGLFEARLYNI